MAAVHPFPEIWTQPSLGVGLRGRVNAVKGGKWMLMDLVSLSFWSYYPVASGTAELIMNVLGGFFHLQSPFLILYLQNMVALTFTVFLIFLSYSQIPCPGLLEAVVKYNKLRCDENIFFRIPTLSEANRCLLPSEPSTTNKCFH